MINGTFWPLHFHSSHFYNSYLHCSFPSVHGQNPAPSDIAKKIVGYSPNVTIWYNLVSFWASRALSSTPKKHQTNYLQSHRSQLEETHNAAEVWPPAHPLHRDFKRILGYTSSQDLEGLRIHNIHKLWPTYLTSLIFVSIPPSLLGASHNKCRNFAAPNCPSSISRLLPGTPRQKVCWLWLLTDYFEYFDIFVEKATRSLRKPVVWRFLTCTKCTSNQKRHDSIFKDRSKLTEFSGRFIVFLSTCQRTNDNSGALTEAFGGWGLTFSSVK